MKQDFKPAIGVGSAQSIGEIIRSNNQLSSEQVEAILAHQKQNGTRFGESAVALGLARREDVVWALAKQFDYPYVNANISTELQAALQPFGKQAEAIRTLRSQLLSNITGASNTRRAIAVLSACVGDGKSYISANLAVSLAQLGGQVALVDADMRTPRLQAIFDLPGNVQGLSHILAHRSDVSLSVPLSSIPNLYVLPVGVIPPNPSELIQRTAFADLIKLLLNRFDHVIVDTPAAEHGSDARTIAQFCQNAVIVARQGHTHSRLLDAFTRELQQCEDVHLAGMIMNQHQ
jgi:protein-tyrosine kinase